MRLCSRFFVSGVHEIVTEDFEIQVYSLATLC